MLEYRRQKLLQEELSTTLECPVFLPRLFTLIGPRTYASQNAAWAQILRARLESANGVMLHEPHSRKAWASEFEVLRCLVRFLAADHPVSLTGPIVSGYFTLHEVARGERVPMRAIDYAIGSGEGWLCGDYMPATPLLEPVDVTDELLRAIAES